jgi:hypothetical protein
MDVQHMFPQLTLLRMLQDSAHIQVARIGLLGGKRLFLTLPQSPLENERNVFLHISFRAEI